MAVEAPAPPTLPPSTLPPPPLPSYVRLRGLPFAATEREVPRHFLDTSQTLPRHFPDTSQTHFPTEREAERCS